VTTTRFPFLEHPGPIAFAHRGGSAEAPENSWAAFEHAIGLGFRYMETDVRVTADGVPVALHDPNLERVTGQAGLIKELNWDQVKRRPLRDGREVPRLEDLLGAWPDLRWNIDVKRPEAAGPVAEALRRTVSAHRVLIAAFSDRRTAMVRAALGHEMGAQLATGAGRATIGLLLAARTAPFLGLRPGRAAAAQVPVRQKGITIVDDAFVRTCHRHEIAVHVWTIDDPLEMVRLLDLGVDGIMTDRPSVLKEVLSRRGEWS
jgi:glycerophosphoryl diester phosphodiesterase